MVDRRALADRTRVRVRGALAVVFLLAVFRSILVVVVTATSDGGSSVSQQQTSPEAQHTIELSSPTGSVEYRLRAPGLQSSDFDADAGETVRGNQVTGVVATGTDTYRFTGPIENVELRSDAIDALVVRIDGRRVDPRTLTPPASKTVSTPTASADETASPTVTSENASNGGSGFDPVMYVLMGIVFGLFIAGGLAMITGPR